MVTNVKMQVTPDLSQRVQEIVFANGGSWLNEPLTEISYLTAPYIYLDCNKQLIHGTLITTYEKHTFKEISAYDFIASHGEQDWLPKYGELVEFSDNKNFDNSYTAAFYYYKPNCAKPYYGIDTYVFDAYCRPIQKTQTKIINIDGVNIELSSESFEALKQQLCKG